MYGPWSVGEVYKSSDSTPPWLDQFTLASLDHPADDSTIDTMQTTAISALLCLLPFLASANPVAVDRRWTAAPIAGSQTQDAYPPSGSEYPSLRTWHHVRDQGLPRQFRAAYIPCSRDDMY
jgi:hypothetical protein